DVVHATAFPYAWGLACARRLARRLNVPFVLTPFVHLGDLDDPRDRTRRGYTSPALLDLARSAAAVFVQTEGGRDALAGVGVLAGPDMPNFRAFWESFRPSGPVVRLGPLDEEQKRDFFAGIDVFALPSRSDSFGLVLPEAWANGAPCVGYRAGGIPWVIRDGVDGLLVRCGDLEGLANALCRLALDGEVRQRLGEAGRQRIGEFDWEAKLHLVRE